MHVHARVLPFIRLKEIVVSDVVTGL